ncbi:LamG domain protein jellyroll fold domain protein [Burkholderiales bacterium GJ-E10]|nr:LamG domain protein jellyroll fold domain protein [Burkholderiales bacterium GJ-E10]
MVRASRVRNLLSAIGISVLTACGGGSGGSSAGATASAASGYKIVANVTGLQSGTSLVLQLNGQNPLVLAANGGVPFPVSLPSGTAYQVAVATQPAGEACSVTNGAGTVAATNVTNIEVACAANPAVTYTLGGTVSGLNGSVTLQDDGGAPTPLSANGKFSLPGRIVDQAAYDVTVSSQPVGQTCTVTDGAGTVQGADITNVSVACVDNPAANFSLGGSIDGLPAGTSVVLDDTVSGTTQAFAANGTFSFDAVMSGHPYDVTVATQPAGGSCTVTNGSGTVGTGNVTNTTVTCNVQYAVGGVVSGLTAGKSVTLLDNNSDTVTVSTNGFFTFPTQLASGATYAVTVGTQPVHQTCAVTNGSGTATADVTSVTLGCTTNPTYAFVANYDSNNVSVYSVGATTGALTQVPGSPFAAGSSPASVTVSPAGTLAFVANANSNNVSVYRIAATTGALTQVPGSPFAAGSSPYSVAVNPAGTLAFVANAVSNDVSVYGIDATTGALTAVPGSPFAAAAPFSVAVNPAGTLAFAASNGSNDVSVYGIDATTGALTQVPGSPFAAGSYPSSVTVAQP